MDQDADYYAKNPDEFNVLTDKQQEEVFNGGAIEESSEQDESDNDLGADAGATEEKEVDSDGSEAEGDEAKDAEEESEATSKADEAEHNNDEEKDKEKEEDPVLLAKDGINTIPYTELQNARARATQFEDFSKQQAQLIEDLQDAKAVDEAAQDDATTSQDQVIEEYAGNYPEIAEELKPVIQQMIDDGVKKGVEDVQKQFEERVAPIQEQANRAAEQERRNTILAEHPDAVEIYSSPELKTWIESHPSFIKDQYETILKESTGEQMNELISAYKLSTDFGVKQDQSKTKDITAKAKDVIEKTEKKAPVSLSDVPGTQAGTIDEAEAMMEMSAAQLDQKFNGKSPEQIRALMAKLV